MAHAGPTTTPMPAPDGWIALRYHGRETGKTYVCPRCERSVASNSQHVVAWPSDDDSARRHWHSGCWASAVKEGLDRYRWA